MYMQSTNCMLSYTLVDNMYTVNISFRFIMASEFLIDILGRHVVDLCAFWQKRDDSMTCLQCHKIAWLLCWWYTCRCVRWHMSITKNTWWGTALPSWHDTNSWHECQSGNMTSQIPDEKSCLTLAKHLLQLFAEVIWPLRSHCIVSITTTYTANMAFKAAGQVR